MAESRRRRLQKDTVPMSAKGQKRSRKRAPEYKKPLDGSASIDHQEYRKWDKRVAHAKRVRRDWEARYLVETCERFFLGNHYGYGNLHPWFDVQENEPVFNYVWSTIQTQLPALFYQNPTFNVTPTQEVSGAMAEQGAAMSEALLDTIAQEDRHLKTAGEFAVIQNYFRLGVLKVLYDPRLERNPNAGEIVWKRDPMTDLPLVPGEPEIDPQTGEPIREPERVTTDEIYRWRWVDAACMLLPDQGPDMSRWTWIGEEVYVPLEVAQEDSRFPESLRSQLRANCREGARRSNNDETGYQEESPLSEGSMETFCYYECWDIWNKKLYIWADGQDFGDRWLYQGDIPVWVEDHPYCIAMGFKTPILGPIPSPWPVPPVFQWLSIQREYNKRRQQITAGAGRSARKGLYEENTFADEDEALKNMQSSQDMTFAKITNLERPPIIMADPPLPTDILQDVSLLQADWRAIAGITASRQATSAPGQSPTEAGIGEQAVGGRELVLKDCIAEMFIQAGTKMLQCLKATLTLDKMVKIRQLSEQETGKMLEQVYGPQVAQIIQQAPNLKQLMQERFGKEQWVKATRENLTFSSRVTIVPGSMKARTTEVERQQLLSFLSILGQSPQLALSRTLLGYVARAFEMENEALLDELNALAHQMVEVNARQAGRYQGGDNPQSKSPTNTPANNNGAPPQVASRLAAALGVR